MACREYGGKAPLNISD